MSAANSILTAALAVCSLSRMMAQDPMSKPKPDSTNKTAADDRKGMLIIDALEPCRVALDDRVLGNLQPGDIKAVPADAGPHLVTAVSLKGGTSARVPVDLKPMTQEAVLLEFPEPAGLSIQANPRDGLEYARIPQGEFTMGCSPGDHDCSPDELPAHPVSISRDYWIGRTEVTQSAYRQFCAKTGRTCPAASDGSPAKQPQGGVSWADADAYCRWSGGRLPTEVEWEYAARGGQPDLRCPTANSISHDDANYSGTGGQDRWDSDSPVGSFAANGYGLFDMAGNLWEWCADWYSPEFYAASPKADPVGPANGATHVVRGGSWNNLAMRLRVSARFASDAATQLPTIGFRCVRESAP